MRIVLRRQNVVRPSELVNVRCRLSFPCSPIPAFLREPFGNSERSARLGPSRPASHNSPGSRTEADTVRTCDKRGRTNSPRILRIGSGGLWNSSRNKETEPATAAMAAMAVVPANVGHLAGFATRSFRRRRRDSMRHRTLPSFPRAYRLVSRSSETWRCSR